MLRHGNPSGGEIGWLALKTDVSPLAADRQHDLMISKGSLVTFQEKIGFLRENIEDTDVFCAVTDDVVGRGVQAGRLSYSLSLVTPVAERARVSSNPVNAERIAEREDFATPFVANASLQSSWLDDTLRTTFWLYYTGEYETIADTAENETRDGIRYDIYDVLVREPSLRSDFNVAYALPETDFGAVELEVRVSNVFNELPNVDTSRSFPYQRGRSFWLGLNYRY